MRPKRTPLVQQGGAIRAAGHPAKRELLVRALEAAATDPPDTLTHGFHTWTARMHPSIAGVLVDALTNPGGAVLDPFSGSGTVVLEAFVAGRLGVGADLNPLAPLLGRVKTQRRNAASRARLDACLRDVAGRSEERVRAREPVLAKVPKWVVTDYDGHVLKELAGLYEELMLEPNVDDRDAMRVVFSSNLVKLSRRVADSSSERTAKTIRKGLATELFLRKGLELVDRYAALYDALPENPIPARFFEEDVRSLASRLEQAQRFDFVLTSPPYGGTYDYAEHHALRFAFLGLDASGLERHELGSRRRSRDDDAEARWNRETAAFLDAMRRCLTRDGNIVLVVGDGLVGGRLVPAVEHLDFIGREVGLEVVAAASEPRPHSGPVARLREEHLVWLEPTKATPRPSRGDERSPRSGGHRGPTGPRRPPSSPRGRPGPR